MLKLSSLAKWGAAALFLSSLTGCEDIFEPYFPKPNPTPPPTIPAPLVAYTSYAIQSGGTFENRLLLFNPTTLTAIQHLSITGLSAPSDRILGLDRRPATGQLYALVGTYTIPAEPFRVPFVSNGRLYTIDPATGAATLVAPLSLLIGGDPTFGFDFNPVQDRIRIVNDEAQSLLVNPLDGVAIEEGRLNREGVPVLSAAGAAYDNNVAGATATKLYIINANLDRLSLLSSPATGALVDIGPLGVNASFTGFDIGATSNQAYAVINGLGFTHLYAINLATGAATDLGDFGFPSSTPEVVPVPTGFTLGAGL